MTDPKIGLAKVNGDWNPADPKSERLVILHPNRIGSFDETCCDPNQMDWRKTNMDKIVKGKGDDGSTVATKGKTKATGVFGRICEYSLPPFIIFGGSGTVHTHFVFEYVDKHEKKKVVPFENIAPDEHGKPLDTLYWSNKTGSMTSESCLTYLQRGIILAFRAQGVCDEDGRRGILFFDGVGCHLSYTFLITTKEAGIACATRVPNSSSETQGEDTVHFRILKPEFFQQKGRRLQALVAGPPVNRGASLSHNDLKYTLPPAHNKAFTKANIAKAFAADGTVPFTQTPLWLARDREAETARQQRIQDSRRELRAVRPAAEVAILGGPAAPAPGAEAGARRGGVRVDDDEEGSDAEADDEAEEAVARPGAIVGNLLMMPLRRAVAGVGVPLESQKSSFQFSGASSEQIRAAFAKVKEEKQQLLRVVRVARDAIDDEDCAAVTRRSAKITAAGAAFAPGGATGPEFLQKTREKHDRLEADAEARRTKERDKGTKEREKKESCKEAYNALVADHREDSEWVESGDFVHYRTGGDLKLILEHAWAQMDPPQKVPQTMRKHDVIDAIQRLPEFAGPARDDDEPGPGDGDEENGNGDDDGNELGDGGGEGRAEDLGAGQARRGGASGAGPGSVSTGGRAEDGCARPHRSTPSTFRR